MKDELRRLAKANLRNLALKNKLELDKKIFSHFLELSKSYQIHSLGIYAPLKDEPDWRNTRLMFDLCFPKILNSTEMEYRLLKLGVHAEELTWKEQDLERKIFGKIAVPDLILAPALGFSKDGFRLGRGNGYYDRFLEDYEGITVGLSYAMNIFDFTPSEYDQKFDFLVTEEGTLEF